MDSSRFDELTKALATATSRRQALKTIGAALGGALGLSRIGTAFAKCHNAGHNCEENSTCCSKLCCIAAGQTEGVCCAVGQVCQNGACVAPTTTTTTTSTTTTSTTPPPCSGLGGPCSSSSNCCSPYVCDFSTRTCVSCIPTNDLFCSTNSDCCSDFCCQEVCCASGLSCSGGPCATTSDCCPGTNCAPDGTCG